MLSIAALGEAPLGSSPGVRSNAGSFAVVEAGDSAAGQAFVSTNVQLTTTERTDKLAAVVKAVNEALFISTEEPDQANIFTGDPNQRYLFLGSRERADVAKINAKNESRVTLEVTERRDTASFTASAYTNAEFYLTERPDVPLFNANITSKVNLVAVERPDRVLIRSFQADPAYIEGETLTVPDDITVVAVPVELRSVYVADDSGQRVFSVRYEDRTMRVR